MNADDKSAKAPNSIEEVAIRSMALTDALYEILADKGIVTADRVIERIKKLKGEIKLNARGPN
jgi:hypothetical protein